MNTGRKSVKFINVAAVMVQFPMGVSPYTPSLRAK